MRCYAYACIFLASVVVGIFCNEATSDIGAKIREKRQGRGVGVGRGQGIGGLPPGQSRRPEDYVRGDGEPRDLSPDNNFQSGRNSGRNVGTVGLDLGVVNNVLFDLPGSQSLSVGFQGPQNSPENGFGGTSNPGGIGGSGFQGGIGGQDGIYNTRPISQGRPQPNGGRPPQNADFNAGRPLPPGQRMPPGHQGPPGRPDNRPMRPGQEDRPGERPVQFVPNSESQGFQSGRPVGQNDQFQNSRPGERPGQFISDPTESQGFQNGRPGGEIMVIQNVRPVDRPGQLNGRPGSSQNGRPIDEFDRVQNSSPAERPGQQNGRPTGSQGLQNGRPVDAFDRIENSRPAERPGQQNGRPAGSQGLQNGRPVDEFGGFENSRPVERPGQSGIVQTGQQNTGFNNQPQREQNQGNGVQQLNYQSNSELDSRPRPNQGGGSKKCRGNQYTCQNRECVPRNARCNGVNECRDGSDEYNCNPTQNNGQGQGSSVDYTTAAPSGLTTASSAGGCILPEQPTGGNYELGSCEAPCNYTPGTRVPISSFLTYRCNTGYTLNGNNVTFCHNNAWYLPPSCDKTCPPLKSNSVDIVCKYRGEIVSCESNIAPETKATLACKHSYKIPLADDPAYRELTCLDEGVWDRTLFRCLPECGTAVAHGNTLIVNGFTAKLGVFPWHVGVYEKNSAGTYAQICAGSLISPDLLVSAAHCFYDDTVNEVMDASKYAIAAGKHYRNYYTHEKYVQKSAVKSIEVASRYYGASGNFAEDIALVRLKKPFVLTTLVRPICMDWDNRHEREQLHSGQSGKAVGWGKTAEGVPSEELQEINLPYIPYQECVSAVPEEFKGYVTADKFCAGYLNGSSLCEGDSGGGLGFQLEGLWYLRGIVSVSPVSENTCDNNYYTAFTNVGRFREWIRAAYVSV